MQTARDDSQVADRRKRRSDECRTAIHFQLLHLAEQFDLRNLVLADGAGLLIACAKNRDAGRTLAAYAPLMERHLARGSRDRVTATVADRLPHVGRDELSVRRFNLEDEHHFLCVVGEKRLARQANLYRAITGVRRIVEQTRTP